jgi:hypothetical protein
MLAVGWSLVGLLAVALGLLATALLSGLSRLDTRIDALSNDLRADIREVREAVQRLDVRLTSAGG